MCAVDVLLMTRERTRDMRLRLLVWGDGGGYGVGDCGISWGSPQRKAQITLSEEYFAKLIQSRPDGMVKKGGAPEAANHRHVSLQAHPQTDPRAAPGLQLVARPLCVPTEVSWCKGNAPKLASCVFVACLC